MGYPEKEKKRERENFPAKSSDLRHCWACSQNKELSEYQRRDSPLWTSPSPTGGREAGWQQPEPEGEGQSQPRYGILYQTVRRLPVANQVFLGSWMVDVHQEGHRQRSAPQRRHTAHLRWCPTAHPGNLSDWDQGIDKICPPPGESALPKHLIT